MQKLVIKILLISFVFSLFSCAKILNENFDFTPPEVTNPDDSQNNNDDDYNDNNDDDYNDNNDDDYNDNNDDDNDDNNDGNDDDNTLDTLPEKINITFDGDGDWHWHWFDPYKEFSIQDCLPDDLNYLNDVIEFRIKGTPTQTVTTLVLEVANDDGTICGYKIPERFEKDVPFERVVKAPLMRNYDPDKNTWFNLCYETNTWANNSYGLRINDFSISAREIKNIGFIMVKEVHNSNLDVDYCTGHSFEARTITSDLSVKPYLNLTLSCYSPENIYDWKFKIVTTNWEYDNDYTIPSLVQGNNNIFYSIPVYNIPEGEIAYIFELLIYQGKDLTLQNLNINVSFSDTPMYYTPFY